MSKRWDKNNITQRPMIKINNNILSNKQLNALKNYFIMIVLLLMLII